VQRNDELLCIHPNRGHLNANALAELVEHLRNAVSATVAPASTRAIDDTNERWRDGEKERRSERERE
jgi:hypothetical protein